MGISISYVWYLTETSIAFPFLRWSVCVRGVNGDNDEDPTLIEGILIIRQLEYAIPGLPLDFCQ